MKNQNLPNRKPTRLPNFDYSTNGLYSVTICTKEKQKILSKIVGGGVPDAPHTVLFPCGKIVDKYINQMNEQYNNINIENYVIMPNHIHLLIFVDNPNGTSRTPSPTNAVIPMFVSTLKRFCNKEIGHNIFQRSFFDHIIRDQADYENVYNYIDSNPSKWESDELYIKD